MGSEMIIWNDFTLLNLVFKFVRAAGEIVFAARIEGLGY
jgi:hypothetical protein